MTTAEKYECPECEASGRLDGEDCDTCDGTGVTAIDCPGCGRQEVPIHETVFVAAYPRTYCESCGDAELNKIAASRGQSHY
jgi:RecJ-like exonuclease